MRRLPREEQITYPSVVVKVDLHGAEARTAQRRRVQRALLDRSRGFLQPLSYGFGAIVVYSSLSLASRRGPR